MHVIFAILAWFALSPRRRVLACALLLAGPGMAGSALADTYHFNGTAVAGCSLSGKVYTCPATNMPNEYDRVVIDSGITVNSQADISFGYNQGLTMSGTARLTSAGNIHIANIATNNLNITGGSISAGKTFTVGNQVQTVTADISAATLMLGSGSTLRLTGTLVATGAVQIASNTTITGPVRGANITTNSPVTIRGDVTATTRFTLASGSTVTGNVTAPQTELYASNSVVTGKVTALTSLVMGSAVRIDGEVDAGQLTLQASNALITGNASVDFAYLQWAGRVSQTIYCKKGTAAGRCDCVDNQSGWDVNTANGPRCEAPKQPSGSLDHLLITHDGSASVCAAKTVTVKACANAACTQAYTGGVDVTMSQGGAKVRIGASGSASAQVTQSTPGDVELGLSHAGSAGKRCLNASTNQASCTMKFSGGMGFEIAPMIFRAGETGTTTIAARAFDEASKTCVAALQGQQKDVQYACAYSAPATGTEQPGLGMSTGSTRTPLACVAAANAASAAGTTVKTSFDSAGQARLALTYEDAGRLLLVAKLDGATGSTTADVVPHRFVFSNLPTKPIRAGAGFGATVSAVSANDNVTKNFDRSRLPAGSTRVAFPVSCMAMAGGITPALQATGNEFTDGKLATTLNWAEVGGMHAGVHTESAFPNTALKVEGNSGTNTLCSSLAFIPNHFLVEQVAPTRTPSNFYYAGEPIPLRVSARNAAGAVTRNFTKGIASEALTLAAFDDAGSIANPNGGVMVAAAVAADAFEQGTAEPKPAYAPATPAAPQKRLPLPPTKVRLRALNAAALANAAADAAVSSGANAAYETARPEIRSGRLRIATRFGRTGTKLDLPVTTEYWTGHSWLLNHLDTFTAIPAAAIAQSASAHEAGGAKPAAVAFGAVQVKNGAAVLALTSNSPGWIDVAVNLGAGTVQDQSCLANHPASTGAGIPWLQSLSGCIDPSSRATFGIYPVESRRIIHVREVFN